MTCPSSVIYNGSAQEPCSATVTGAGGLNQSLTVSYTANINVGTVTASAAYPGDANYSGSSATKTFEIRKAPSTTTVICPTHVTYTGSAQTPCTVTVVGAGGLNLSPAASYTNNVNAGTATASYDFAGDENHDGSSDSETFAIAKASSTTTITCSASVTYTGDAQTPCTVAVVGAGGLNLSPAASYTNNVNAGTATASYDFAGDENHDGSSGNANFVINKAKAVVTVNGYTGAYDGLAHGATGSARGASRANRWTG